MKQKFKKIFDLYDINHTGRIYNKEILSTLIDCGCDKKNPILFKVLADLDKSGYEKNDWITFLNLIDIINKKLLGRNTDEALRNLYSIFVGDTKTIRKEPI